MLSARTIYGEMFDNDEAFGLFCSLAASGKAQGGWENGKIAALVPGSQAGLAAKVAWLGGWRRMVSLRMPAVAVFASTGLARLLPAGPAAAAAWQAGQYRRRDAAALASSGLSVLGEAGLLAAAFEVAGTPVPWRGLLLACAAGQLGARLVPLPGGLGGMEGGVLGALALTGTHPATALTAVIIYRVAGSPGTGHPAPPAPSRPLSSPAATRPRPPGR